MVRNRGVDGGKYTSTEVGLPMFESDVLGVATLDDAASHRRSGSDDGEAWWKRHSDSETSTRTATFETKTLYGARPLDTEKVGDLEWVDADLAPHNTAASSPPPPLSRVPTSAKRAVRWKERTSSGGDPTLGHPSQVSLPTYVNESKQSLEATSDEGSVGVAR